jgi:hypothetical protein
MSLKKYITKKRVDHFTKGGIHVFVKDPLPSGIDAASAIQDYIESVPSHLLRNIETIYIGKFKELEDRDIQAMYENSSIFVTNKQRSEEDMLNDLIHETGHSVEEIYRNFLYSDQKMESEFLRKRKELWHELKRENLETSLSYFLEPEYSKEFDNYLYKQVGYPMLSVLTANLFYSPYASTSLREYFANGFEAFFMREDIDRLKNTSPVLFSKLAALLDEEELKQ